MTHHVLLMTATSYGGHEPYKLYGKMWYDHTMKNCTSGKFHLPHGMKQKV